MSPSCDRARIQKSVVRSQNENDAASDFAYGYDPVGRFISLYIMICQKRILLLNSEFRLMYSMVVGYWQSLSFLICHEDQIVVGKLIYHSLRPKSRACLLMLMLVSWRVMSWPVSEKGR